MKRRGHKHRETFSILMISNTGQRSKQFHISRLTLRILFVFLILLLANVGLSGWMIHDAYFKVSEQDNLQEQLSLTQEQVAKLEQEKQTLEEENAALRQENENNAAEGTETDSEDASDSDIPSRYPASGRSTILASYSEEAPYLSINMNTGDIIIAAGSGMVVQVTSDDTYPLIIELEHKKNYKARYMCHQSADILVTEGAQVEAGDTLFTITTNDTQLDYQITYDGNPIDPLTVIEAKG